MRRISLLEKDMALVSARETVDLPRSASVDSCPPRFPSLEVAPLPRQLASEPRQSASEPGQSASEPRQSSSGDSVGPIAGGSSDRSDTSSSSPKRSLDDENQSPIVLRSEEYRQLFRLPPDEVLVQDFNCAFQESILLQGHMYLFINHICFYSNIFGFETKKIISFHEVTSVKRAKTAGIFPNAIEIFAGEKKYFFASFLSRDEAFKLIHDNWLERGNDVNTAPERQDSISEAGSQENKVVIENSSSPVDMTGGLDSSVRNGDAVLNHPQPPESSKQSDALTSDSNVGQHAETTVNIGTSSPTKSWTWKLEDSSAPKIPGDYTKVAETKFMIQVEDFFMLFFSDSAVNFVESFHKTCGDKEFRCTSWRPHEKFGHTRDVSFQHPIKIYFGAKFGSCQEMQKFKVYRNRHLVIETSQEISDVPYGDYFTVEGLYDVQRESIESKEACKLQVYINVAFSKRTVWKGKIVQSTVEECREVYAAWIEKAHALLKEKNLEKETGSSPVDDVIQNNSSSERERRTEEPIEPTQNSQTSSRVYLNPRAVDLFQRSLRNVTSVASTFRDASVKSCSFLRSQSNISQVLVIAFAVILLLQVTILVLLNRPQHIHIPPPPMGPGWGNMGDRSAETISWMEKRVHYLKDEMLMVESRLQTMWHEHAVLKSHLKDLEQLQKQ